MTLEYWLFLFLSQVDDGTAVIDCNHHQPQPPQPKVDAKRISSELPAKVEPPPALKPLAKVGNFVKVVGKVRAVHSSRQINVDRIGLSMNITSWLLLTELLIGRDMQFSKWWARAYENCSPVASDFLFFKRFFRHSTSHISTSFYYTNQKSSQGHANSLKYSFLSSFFHIIQSC